MKRSDGLNGMRSADGLRACFRQAEVPDLALLDQILDRPRYVFNGHLRINAMLIEQIDRVGLEPSQRTLDAFFDIYSGRLFSPTGCGFSPESI